MYEEQRKRDAAQLIDEERSRITADLHDGVAGHLTTIVALSEQPEQATGDIRQSARNALMDLRLVIDTMAVKSESLRYYLGLFRDRVVQPLENLGIEIVWSTTRLPEVEAVHPEQALNIMRILQEAVNNAMRHTDVKRIDITGQRGGPNDLTLTVRNFGAPTGTKKGSGLGIDNMRRRAQALGGSVTLETSPQGGNLVLTLPIANLRQ